MAALDRKRGPGLDSRVELMFGIWDTALAKDTLRDPSWDSAAAVSHLREAALPASSGQCAKFVRQAVEAGGVILARTPDAKDYGASLLQAGFFELPPGYEPAAGDIAIIQPIKGHPHGHACMFDGKVWISDFKQYHGFYPGPEYRLMRPEYKIYRHN